MIFAIANVLVLRGNAILQRKIDQIIFEKRKKKYLVLTLLFDLGQIKSGKWTGGERRRKHNCIVLCSDVVT